MVVDSSALLALFYDEPECEALRSAMEAASGLCISAVSVVESLVAVLRKRGEAAVPELQELMAALQLETVAVEGAQIALAVRG